VLSNRYCSATTPAAGGLRREREEQQQQHIKHNVITQPLAHPNNPSESTRKVANTNL
jgi:hypothetical protein